MEFPFYEGMSHEDIMKNLKGKVSGEDTQQLATILEVRTKTFEQVDLIKGEPVRKTLKEDQEKFVITKANKEYALLTKLRRKLGRWTLNRRFLLGINDDDKFFIHPLFGYPKRALWAGINVTKIVEWMDRNNEGFQRVQGDLLVGYTPWYSHLIGSTRTYHVKNPVVRHTNRDITYKSELNIEKPYMVDDVSFNIFMHKIHMRANTDYPMVGFSHDSRNNFLVCMAQEVEIVHPQHKTVKYTNARPETHAMVFTTQRGQPPQHIGVD